MGNNKNRISKEKQLCIINEYLNGKPSTILSKIYKVSESSILRILVKNDIARRKSGFGNKIKPEIESREIGKTYNYLTIVKRYDTSNRINFLCKCICGNESVVSLGNLKTGSVKSCGCKKTELLRTSFERKDKQEQLFEYLFKDYKKGAVSRNLEFDLSEHIFKELIFKECFYCGESPKQLRSHFKFKDKDVYYNGIDRLDSNLGYYKENCVTCCKMCNYAKRNISYKDYINWIEKSYINLKSKHIIPIL